MQEEEKKDKTIRPTKKQFEILEFIEKFIEENGYSPSYREIMSGLNYTSVSTVALHVNSLLKRGHLIKRDHSARSIEVVSTKDLKKIETNQVNPKEEKWLVDKVDSLIKAAESNNNLTEKELDELYVLSGALRILGIEGATSSFNPRLSELKKKLQ